MADKKSKSSNKVGVGLGAGLAIAAAAAAGAYFLYGTKEGARQRKKISAWSIKMKGEVLEKLENAKELNEATYRQVVDAVGDKYRKVKSIDSADVDKAVKELKSHWRSISRHAQGKKPSRKKTAKKKK